MVMENMELYVLIEFVCESKDIVGSRNFLYMRLFVGVAILIRYDTIVLHKHENGDNRVII